MDYLLLGGRGYTLSYGICCCSVAMLCLTLCDPMDCSTPGLPVPCHLLELEQVHVHWIGWIDAIQSSHPPPPSSLFAFNLSPASGSFPVSRLLASGDQSIGASASALVLPVNSQNWFPIRLIGLISLLSKGLARVFSSTTVQKHQFFGVQPSLWNRAQ